MEWAQSQPSLALALGFSAGFLIALIFVGLIGGGPLRLFAPIARLLALPLRPFIFLLRLVRILPKASGRISDRYREATGIARGVTVGDETDSKKLSEAARKWHKIMIWMPFRTFFIECFVRNVLYQINRNCTYYLYIVPLTLLLIAGAAVLAVETHWIALADFTTIEGAALIVGFLFVALFYVERINKVVIAEELDQLDWLGYDNLNVSAAMDDVVGKYAEDVGFWKGRLDR